MRRRSLRRVTVLAGLAAGVAVVCRRGTVARRVLEDACRATVRRLRYLPGAIQGARYRAAGRRPDPGVPDDVLADRIRSSLGPIEKRRDLPHVHVTVEDHVALLHGDVATDADADAIVGAVRAVSGVNDVESRLHIGLVRGDTRPSEGRGRLAIAP